MELFSLEAEKAVLSAISLENTAIEEIGLTVDDFYHQAYKVLFIAMKELYNANIPIDMTTLSDKVDRMGKLDDIGGLKTIMDICMYLPTAANVKHHANIVKQNSLRREFVKIAKEMEIRSDDCEEITPLIEEMQMRMLKLTETTAEKQAVHVKESAERYLGVVGRTLAGGVSGLATDFVDLNAKLKGGFKKGELIILAARPAMGKTALAMNLATSASKNNVALFFSLEMSEEQLMQRLFKSIAKEYGKKFEGTREEKIEMYRKTAATVAKRHLFVYDNSKVTVADMRHIARQVKHKNGGLDLIVVDYLQLISSERVRRSDSKATEVGEITRALKIMARELEVPVIVLSQLNRGVELREDKRPLMSDLRDSGSIEQDADIVMFLYRGAYYGKKDVTINEAELIIAKNRMGNIGTVNLFFDPEATYFKNGSARRPD